MSGVKHDSFRIDEYKISEDLDVIFDSSDSIGNNNLNFLAASVVNTNNIAHDTGSFVASAMTSATNNVIDSNLKSFLDEYDINIWKIIGGVGTKMWEAVWEYAYKVVVQAYQKVFLQLMNILQAAMY